jgi:aminoglycoside phosphotransferase (APT) family kinase protein
MHDGEAEIDAGLVGRLVAGQFPGLAGLPVREVASTGTVNAIYRLGDELYARLPRMPRYARDLEREWQWLPELAPALTLRVPEPVARGRPTAEFPLTWVIYRVDPRRPAPAQPPRGRQASPGGHRLRPLEPRLRRPGPAHRRAGHR